MSAYYYIEVNTSNGSVNRIRTTPALFQTLNMYLLENTVCGISPSKNYLYVSGVNKEDSTKIYMLRQDLLNPENSFSAFKLEQSFNYWLPNMHVPITDTHVIFSGFSWTNRQFDSASIASMTWAPTPTFHWCKRYINWPNSWSENVRLITYPDNSKVISCSATVQKELIFHVLAVADGTVIKKGRISGGFSKVPITYGMALKDSSSLLLAARDGTTGTGTLFELSLTDFTGSAYTSTAPSFYSFLTGKMSDENYWLGEADTANNKYIIHKLSSANLGWLGITHSASNSFTMQQITNTDYDLSDHTLTLSAVTTIGNVAASLTASAETATVENQKSFVMNDWTSATEQALTGGTTGGTFTLEYTCVVATGLTDPSVSYSLIAGSGSVPSWVSIDSSTALITYDTPNATSTETFAIRSTFDGNTALAYDTSITISVTAVASVAPVAPVTPVTPVTTPAPSPSSPGSSPNPINDTSTSINNKNESDSSSEPSCYVTSGVGQ